MMTTSSTWRILFAITAIFFSVVCFAQGQGASECPGTGPGSGDCNNSECTEADSLPNVHWSSNLTLGESPDNYENVLPNSQIDITATITSDGCCDGTKRYSTESPEIFSFLTPNVAVLGRSKTFEFACKSKTFYYNVIDAENGYVIVTGPDIVYFGITDLTFNIRPYFVTDVSGTLEIAGAGSPVSFSNLSEGSFQSITLNPSSLSTGVNTAGTTVSEPDNVLNGSHVFTVYNFEGWKENPLVLLYTGSALTVTPELKNNSSNFLGQIEFEISPNNGGATVDQASGAVTITWPGTYTLSTSVGGHNYSTTIEVNEVYTSMSSTPVEPCGGTIKVNIDHPNEAGADRLVNSYAAEIIKSLIEVFIILNV